MLLSRQTNCLMQNEEQTRKQQSTKEPLSSPPTEIRTRSITQGNNHSALIINLREDHCVEYSTQVLRSRAKMQRLGTYKMQAGLEV